MSVPALVPSNLISWAFLVVRVVALGLVLGLFVDLVISVSSGDQRRQSAATEESPSKAGCAYEWVMASAGSTAQVPAEVQSAGAQIYTEGGFRSFAAAALRLV